MPVCEPVQSEFGVALVKPSATHSEIKACERGGRAGQRAIDRLTHLAWWEKRDCPWGAQASAPLID